MCLKKSLELCCKILYDGNFTFIHLSCLFHVNIFVPTPSVIENSRSIFSMSVCKGSREVLMILLVILQVAINKLDTGCFAVEILL